ncbi:MAG: TlpA disulfide reductase family protein [Bacillota bacterium]|nr:TlpA disulfide reductase family protein [Bacillota bacterium]
MKKSIKIWLLLLVMATIWLSGCGEVSGGARTGDDSAREMESSLEQEAESASDLEGEEVSSQIEFEGQDIEGNEVSSTVFSETKLTMVNVWATYCNPCLSEMPGLGELAGEYDLGEFQIIGIISDVQAGADQKTIDYAKELIEQTGADYLHLLLNESLYYALLTDVTAVPTTFFVDQDGRILDTVVGSMEKSAWEEKINALLEEQ